MHFKTSRTARNCPETTGNARKRFQNLLELCLIMNNNKVILKTLNTTYSRSKSPTVPPCQNPIFLNPLSYSLGPYAHCSSMSENMVPFDGTLECLINVPGRLFILEKFSSQDALIRPKTLINF